MRDLGGDAYVCLQEIWSMYSNNINTVGIVISGEVEIGEFACSNCKSGDVVAKRVGGRRQIECRNCGRVSDRDRAKETAQGLKIGQEAELAGAGA